MGRLKNTAVDPENPKSVAQAVEELLRVVDKEISFGDPLDPNDEQSVVLAGGTGLGSHNGHPSNIVGTWVEVEFEALDTPVIANHNLGVPIINTEVNVRWFEGGIRHSGAGVVAGDSSVSVVREDGDTLTTNSIALRAYAAASRTVSAANPVRVSLFFVPATRWPN